MQVGSQRADVTGAGAGPRGRTDAWTLWGASLGTVREWNWRAEFIEHLVICYGADQPAVVYHRQASDQSFSGLN